MPDVELTEHGFMFKGNVYVAYMRTKSPLGPWIEMECPQALAAQPVFHSGCTTACPNLEIFEKGGGAHTIRFLCGSETHECSGVLLTS